MPETKPFQAEAKQLLHLMVHSLYSNKEIFLRELISNASDAADKLRFESLSKPKLQDLVTALQVRIETDDKNKTLTVSDNGIGMSRDEVINNLGTIAKSGTAQFLESLTGDQQQDAQLIGQFGVGFYSAFIVADEVEVLTRKAGEPANTATLWKSKGEAEYTIEDAQRAEPGSSVTLKLKSGEHEFADPFRLRGIVRKYADHISIPVMMEKLPAPQPTTDDDNVEAKDIIKEFESINQAKALWTRPRKDIKDDEYKEFYKHISHDFADPLDWSHNKVEGKLQYSSLLYVPAKAPFDLWQRDAARGLKLYVQRVFIMDDAEQFLPLYLRFMRGVVDSSDISLNVSREILQQDPVVESMRGALTKRALDMLEKLRQKDKAVYDGFWQEFGQVLKEGPAEDFSNREKIAGLLQFTTTASSGDKQERGLADYVAAMKKTQDKIYYLLADSLNTARSSPHLEIFCKKDIEVLLLTDRIDEWLVSHLHDFDGKALQDVARGELDLSGLEGGKEKEQQQKQQESEEAKFKGLIDRIKTALEGRAAEVRFTHRLTDSPACLAVAEGEPGMQMRRILEASGQKLPDSKPIFEVNPSHPLIERLHKTEDDTRFKDLLGLLFDQACLADGRQLAEPGEFSKRLNKLLLELP